VNQLKTLYAFNYSVIIRIINYKYEGILARFNLTSLHSKQWHLDAVFLTSVLIARLVESFEASVAVMFWVEAFWVVMLCSVAGYQRFRGPCSIFRVKMEAAWTSEALVSYHHPETLTWSKISCSSILDYVYLNMQTWLIRDNSVFSRHITSGLVPLLGVFCC